MPILSDGSVVETLRDVEKAGAATGLASAQAALWAVLAFAVVALVVAATCARRIYRRAIARQLVNGGERLLPGAALSAGLSATVRLAGQDVELRGDIASIAPDEVTLCIPMKGMAPRTLSGTPVVVTAGMGRAALRFHAEVRGSATDGSSASLRLSMPEWVERVQRRAFFRVSVQADTVVTVRKPEHDPPRSIRGTILSLSAGGVCATLTDAVPEGAIVGIRVALSDAGADCGFDARALFCAEDRAEDRAGDRVRGKEPFVMRCEFLYISEETRNMLVNHCFAIERAAR